MKYGAGAGHMKEGDGLGLEKNSTELQPALKSTAPPENSQHYVAELVHEIRNPLATIKGFLQLIKPYLKEVGKDRYAEIALTELDRANELIDNFLKGTTIQSNFVQPLSLNQVVNDLALLYESEAILKNIQFVTDLSHQDVVLSIPTDPLKQIFMNLINNAIEALDENNKTDRKIWISTQIDSPMAAIKITDNGSGITDANINNLFIPYYTSKENGTGIGLCICKKIIEDHNGSISVNSIPGKYTTFTLCFPVNRLLSV